MLPNLHYHMAEQLLMIGEVADESSRSANKFWKRIKRSREIWKTDEDNLTQLIRDTGLIMDPNAEPGNNDETLRVAIEKAGGVQENENDFWQNIRLYYQKVKQENSGDSRALPPSYVDSIDQLLAGSIKRFYDVEKEANWPKSTEKKSIEFLRSDQTVFDRLVFDYVKNLDKLPFTKVMATGYVISWPWFSTNGFKFAFQFFNFLGGLENIKKISEEHWPIKLANNTFNAITAIFEYKNDKKVVITATTASPRQLSATIPRSVPELDHLIGEIKKGDCGVKFLKRQTNPEVYLRVLHQVGLQVHSYSMISAVKVLKESLDYRIL